MLLGIALAMGCFRATAQSDAQIGRAQQLQCTPGGYIGGLTITPDGRLAIFVRYESATNLVGLTVNYWPEGLAGITGFFVVCMLVWSVRLKPQITGKLCCAKCGYCVDGSGQVCSECGMETTKRKPIVGRSRWSRSRVRVATSAVLCIGYVLLHAFHVSRTPQFARDHAYWSVTVAQWNQAHPVPAIGRFTSRVVQVVEVDLKSEKTIETGLSVPLRTYTLQPEYLSNDGSAFIVHAPNEKLIAVRVDAMEELGSVQYGAGQAGIVQVDQIRMDRDGSKAYFARSDPAASATYLNAWSCRDQSATVLFRSENCRTQWGDLLPLRLQYLPKSERVLWMARIPDGRTKIDLRMYSRGDNLDPLHTWDGLVCLGEPSVDRDERFAYVLEADPQVGAVVGRLDLETGGRRVMSEAKLDLQGQVLACAYDSAHKRLLVCANNHPSRIVLVDLETGAQLGAVDLDSSVCVRQIALAEQAQTALILAIQRSTTPVYLCDISGQQSPY